MYFILTSATVPNVQQNQIISEVSISGILSSQYWNKFVENPSTRISSFLRSSFPTMLDSTWHLECITLLGWSFWFSCIASTHLSDDSRNEISQTFKQPQLHSDVAVLNLCGCQVQLSNVKCFFWDQLCIHFCWQAKLTKKYFTGSAKEVHIWPCCVLFQFGFKFLWNNAFEVQCIWFHEECRQWYWIKIVANLCRHCFVVSVFMVHIFSQTRKNCE